MLENQTSDLRGARLRSSSQFQLISFDELEASQRWAFKSLTEEPDFYGLLMPPRNSALPVKSMSRDAALLFQTLREPARVPHLLTSLFGANADAHIRRLILDGVLEVESKGRFLSGMAAFPQPVGDVDEVSTYIARLSKEAITYGAALEGLSVREIAARLYMFNRAPCTSLLQSQFAQTEQVVAYLVESSAVAKLLASHWVREVSQGAWLVWRSSESGPPFPFKLYISPTLDALPEVFRLTVDTLARIKCTRFKIGLTAFGLLRPDKLVAYFAKLEDLQQASELMCVSAAGIPAHGVPFSGAIDSEGLVSWGMDPPHFEQLLGSQSAQSWRQWVAERVAVYITAAKESGTENITKAVLQRLAMDGIDTATWGPSLAIWRGLGEFPQEDA